MTIDNLTPQQQSERVAMYMRRTLAQLRDLAYTMHIDPTGSKAQLAARIVENSAIAKTDPRHFDMTGLYIRVGYVTEAGR